MPTLLTVVICDGDLRTVNSENCARTSSGDDFLGFFLISDASPASFGIRPANSGENCPLPADHRSTSTFNTQIYPAYFNSCAGAEVQSSLLLPTTPHPYPFPTTTVHSAAHIRLDCTPSALVISTHILSFPLPFSFAPLLHTPLIKRPATWRADTGGICVLCVPVDLAKRVGAVDAGWLSV